MSDKGGFFETVRRPGRSDFYLRQDGADVLVIVDRNLGNKSVTNDVERVIQDVVSLGFEVDAMRVIYRDSEREWAMILTESGRFVRFLKLDVKTEAEAIALVR